MKATFTLARSRALRELQLQQGFTVNDGKNVIGSAFPAEFVSETQLKKLQNAGAMLLLSPARAAVLNLKPQYGALAVDSRKYNLKQLWALVAGNHPQKPLQMIPPKQAAQLIALAKQAGVLPALFWIPDTPIADSFSLPLAALMHEAPAGIVRGETVALPIEEAENTSLTSFRTEHGTGVHLALVIGDVSKSKAPLVRVHSSCVTGDLLGSMRCDCGGQLQKALKKMKDETAGILLYLYQEGRDIGITSKLRAYALQERGADTFSANQQLGFEEDERDFSVARAILKSLGYTKIRLLTNNPDKIKSFDGSGIQVVERVALHTGDNIHNHHYIDTKKKKRGHLL